VKVDCEFPLKIESTLNKREHWGARATRAKIHREAGFLCAPREFALPCRITLTRIAPRALDDDNLAGGFKSVRDGIADRLKVNDRDPRIQWCYSQERGKPKDYRVRVEFCEL